MSETKTIGTLIHGTTRTQDLLPAFIGEIAKTKELSAEYAQMTTSGAFSYIPAYAEEDDDSEWWDSEEAQSKVVECMELLDEVAPDFCYFGSHEGDGSDYGFWVDWEGLEMAEHDGDIRRVEAGNGWPDGYRGGYLLEVNDHGNTTLRTKDSIVWELV